MLRRHALTALTLGSIAGLSACRDSLAAGLADDPRPDLEKLPEDATQHDGVRQHIVVGGGGCRLHVLETGSPRGQSILFIHGFSQNALTWTAQLDSALRHRYRLVAMDLRGHGASDRPTAGYDDSKLWADDI